MRHLSLSAILCIIFSALALPAAFADTIHLGVSGVSSATQFEKSYGPFKKSLEDLTGQKIEVVAFEDRKSVADVLTHKGVDFVLTDPADYVALRKKSFAYPVVALRKPDEFSVIVTLSRIGYRNLRDLRGKKIAFQDQGSAVGHLVPARLLAEAGVDPTRDITPLFAPSQNILKSLKNVDVDAVAMRASDFLAQRSKGDNFRARDFTVLARSQDLPPEVLVAGQHVRPQLVEKVKSVLTTFSTDILLSLQRGDQAAAYQGVEVSTTVSEQEFEIIRQAYATLGHSEFLSSVADG